MSRRPILLELAPEGVDAGVELVRHLLKGLVSLARQDVEGCVRDRVGDEAAEARRQDDVELTGQHERRRGDLREAVDRVVRQAYVDLRLKGLDGLLVGEGQGLLDDLSTVPSSCARAV